MDKLAVVILAAGLGKRVGGDIPKAVLRTSENKPLVTYVIENALALSPEKVVVVTGYKKEVVESSVRETIKESSPVSFAYQSTQRGTGDAVKCAMPALSDFCGTVLILYGDTPLVKVDTLKSLIKTHERENATLTILSLIGSPKNDYGRIVRDLATGHVSQVVEKKDCSAQHLMLTEFNAGMYLVDSAFLKPALDALTDNNAQKELYLTDIVAKCASEGQRLTTFATFDEEEVQGVNNRWDLKLVNGTLMKRRIMELVLSGVDVQQPESLFIDSTVTVAQGVAIGPNVQLRGNTSIEEGVVIDGSAIIKDTLIKKGAHIKFGVQSEKSVVGEKASVGPFAHLRPNSILKEDSRVGNFVETKNVVLGKGVKASHLTYLGDCEVGEGTNIGAGTITCNYDGYTKSKTTIGKNVFIGSNSSLVAPLKVGDGALVAAGSVITKDVEQDALALGRGRQEVKPGWAKNRRELLESKRQGHSK